MIQSVEIENVQSHKKTFLEFVPGVNIIVGLSDAGKSAILRALRYCIKNQPSGEDIRSWWGGDTSVVATFDNGQISRIRKSGFNGYVLGKSEFVALKSDVPDEVKAFVNMSDTNLQQQLDASFLLSNTSGEVAKYFNKIANLDKIDTATVNVNSWISKLSQDIKYKESDLEANEKKLQEFGFIEKLEIEVEALEVLENRLTIKRKKQKELRTLFVKLTEINEEIETYSSLLLLGPKIDHLLAKFETKRQKEYEYAKLRNLFKQIQANEEKLEGYNEIIPAGNLIDSLLVKSKEYSVKLTEYNRLKKLFQQVSSISAEIKNAEKVFEKAHQEFDENMPDICPLCNK
jgi:DNA repair protein SbcC/Rad50